jgi:uncharacterized protein YbjT (DUF2867 family)
MPHFPVILGAIEPPASSSAQMRILVTGASGFVGSLLVPRLLSDGHAVRALGRDPARVNEALAQQCAPGDATEVAVVRGDALTGEGLSRALAGVEVAYYLIHSMERSALSHSAGRSSRRNSGRDPYRAGPFAERERVAADRFGSAAARAGVRRIVYLGGLLPAARSGGPPLQGETGPAHVSRHLASRAAVERILLQAVPESVALRASIVIGARSRSFRLLVHLVERMPVLALPAWRRFRTQPIDARDVAEMLVASATAAVAGRSLDIAGPDMLSYEEMLTRIADLMLVNRPVLGIGVSLTPVAARLAAAIAGEDPDLVLPLMESLHADLLPADDHAAELLNVHLHTFDSAVEHALSEWEESEPLAAR